MAEWMRGWALACVLLTLSLGRVSAQPSSTPLRQFAEHTWQTQNGLPQNTVRSIVQTQDGYIWLATDEGLVRFNGVDFVVFNHANTPELASDIIEDLTEDLSGRLWIGTSNGLTMLSSQRFQGIHGMASPGSGPVWLLHRDAAGHLWVATSEGLCLIRNDECVAIAGTNTLGLTSSTLFAEDSNGSIWMATGRQLNQIGGRTPSVLTHLTALDQSDISALGSYHDHLLIGTRNGLQLYAEGHLSQINVTRAPRHVEITSLLEDDHGSVWIGTSDGLARYDRGHAWMQTLSGAAAHMRIKQLFKDQRGSLWIALEHGVLRMTAGILDRFQPNDILANAAVLRMMQDREGSMWFGTESDGLAMLHRQKFLTYTTLDGLAGNVVKSVVEDEQSRVWIGTDGSGVDQFNQGRFSALTTLNGLSSNSILSMAPDHKGQLWVGTPTGLNAVLAGTIRKYTAQDGLADDFVRSLLSTADGTVWAGTAHGLSRLQNGRFTTYTSMDGLGSDFVGAMLQRQSGEIWISTSGGISRYKRGAFSTLTTRNGLASNIVTAMHEDSNGTVWLASAGGVIDRIRGDTIASITSTLLPQTIYAVLEDASTNLWLSSRSGIFRVAKDELDHAIDTHTDLRMINAYDVTDGMDVRECSGGGHPAASKMHDGTLWFATMHGVTVVDPEHLDENKVAPPVVLESLLVDDRSYDVTRTWKFKPGAHRIEVQFAGLSYVAPQKTRYRYRLEGIDKNWIDGGARRAAFYNNLPPGSYRFLVQAENSDGIWSERAASVHFEIQPHFYQVIWFYLLLALALATLGYVIYQWRLRQIASVYESVMNERTRIAREIHDTLAQSIVSISVQLEVVSRLMGSSVETARKQLDETRALVRQSLDEARSSIWDLRMQSSEVQDLPKRLGGILRRLTIDAKVAGALKVHGTYRALPPANEDQLAKIVQEAITNAVRHSRCNSVELTLDYRSEQLRVIVADNGQGLGEDARSAGERGHFGLRGMQERADQLGATLDIASIPQSGTRITLQLPIS